MENIRSMVIGFSFTESITTTTDYNSLKVILQGLHHNKTYIIPKTAALTYKATINTDFTAQLKEGTYNYILIGQSQNADEIISQSKVKFKADPLSSLRVLSYYETVLNNIEGFLKDPDSTRHSEYRIDDREIKRYDYKTLINLRERFSKLVAMEEKGISTTDQPKAILMQF